MSDRRWELLALGAVCALAAALRFATLGVQSIDYDEAFTLGRVIDGSLGHVLRTIPRTESTPPLYYLLAWLWSRVFGLGPVAVRSLSALVGTALVPLAFSVVRRLSGARAGLVAALLLAVNPLLVWYAQESRAYALLALLSALSFWAFCAACDRPDARRLGLWALASSAALLTHYFAAFLVVPEGMWLVARTRRRNAVAACAGVLAVAGALLPLALRQADHRTEWIERMPLWGRIKEVVKKWVTGEISPTRNWELALVAAAVLAACLWGLSRLAADERAGLRRAVVLGTAAALIPLGLEAFGVHYLISKNVMPALTVLLLGLGLVLGAREGGARALSGAAVLAAGWLFLAVDVEVSPSLQRPDYRGISRALGPPVLGQAVVVVDNVTLGYYRPGIEGLPAGGAPVDQVVVALPVPRADLFAGRVTTRPPPPGFALSGRVDAGSYTLICYAAPAPRPLTPAALRGLETGGAAGFVWPNAPARTSHPRSSKAAASASSCPG